MLKRFFVFIIFLGLGSITAQTFSPKISRSTSVNEEKLNNINDISILAVMVDFQVDDFELTYGDGTFGSIYSQEYGNDIIDPLPHNKSYFEDHLQFAKNYYDKVSNGNVNIDYNVLPNIVTVSMPMREYSPVGDESFKRLANFSEEVWSLVDQQNPSFDFSPYNTFIIFHAGTGKDISTSDLFGEARDLPSIYLGLNTLKNYYTPQFNGFQQSDGTFITNTIILPETESREEEGFGGVTLIELSINGLIVSSIASHIGLPDLFDAETGKSAIGRFGLMDGQSLFAFGGLFPPEPSAWEKVFLGWENPQLVNTNSDNILVTASQIATESDAKIIKVPINSTEYYLIENRARDANNDGATITYKVGGEIRTITFQEDLNNFNNAVIDTLKGVVLDVDEFDWATPGNGILIWHIDEKIIDANLAANRINIGDKRGVDLEEADGIQDIGQEFQTIFGDIVIAEGEEYDFWYSSNTSELYKNEFGVDTKPSTITNSGANSLITFSNFSDISSRMSFDLSFNSTNLSFVRSFKRVISDKLTDLKLNSSNNSFALYGSDLWDISTLAGSLELNEFSSFEFSLVEYEDVSYHFGAFNNKLNVVHNESQTIIQSVEFEGLISAPIVSLEKTDNSVDLFLGLTNGNILKYNYNFLTKELPILIENVSFFNDSIDQILTFEDEIVVVSQERIKFHNGEEYIFPAKIKKVALTKGRDSKQLAVVLTDDNSFHIVSSGEQNTTTIYQSDYQIESFSMGDIKNDGENYIVFNSANKIYAINLIGSIAEKFPFILKNDNKFTGYPLLADVDNNNQGDILSTTENGDIYAISGTDGRVISGFPISIGGKFSGLHTTTKRANDFLLSASTELNEIYFWSINSTGNIDWGSRFGNNSNSSSLGLAKSDNFISTFFPKNKTYNWPNPVYGNETFIRTYVNEDSQVKVKVFDLSGDLVDEFEFQASGGLDTDYSWNVADIQSGAYFAHIEVKSNSGKSETKIIKIAVVK